MRWEIRQYFYEKNSWQFFMKISGRNFYRINFFMKKFLVDFFFQIISFGQNFHSAVSQTLFFSENQAAFEFPMKILMKTFTQWSF